jgi:hypothetical protein
VPSDVSNVAVYVFDGSMHCLNAWVNVDCFNEVPSMAGHPPLP